MARSKPQFGATEHDTTQFDQNAAIHYEPEMMALPPDQSLPRMIDPTEAFARIPPNKADEERQYLERLVQNLAWRRRRA
jgi:hypothetical protein